MDNYRRRIQTGQKCFERENMHWPYQRSSTYSAILFFPVESTGKGLLVFHGPNQNFRRRERLLCILRDRLQETENIKLCLALCWLFDVKRFVTHSLLSLIPARLRQIRATIAGQTRALNRPTRQQILSGRVLRQL